MQVGSSVDFTLNTNFQILNMNGSIDFYPFFNAFKSKFENGILPHCDVTTCFMMVYRRNGTFYILAKHLILYPCQYYDVLNRFDEIKDHTILLEMKDERDPVEIMLMTEYFETSEIEKVKTSFGQPACRNGLTVHKDVLEDCGRIQVLKTDIDLFDGVFDILLNKSLDTQNIIESNDVMLTVCLSDYMYVMAATNKNTNLIFERRVLIALLIVLFI